jgi:hypothetical protein
MTGKGHKLIKKKLKKKKKKKKKWNLKRRKQTKTKQTRKLLYTLRITPAIKTNYINFSGGALSDGGEKERKKSEVLLSRTK